MKKTINIEGEDFTIEELKRLIENFNDPMEQVYKYHNTTEEKFNKLYDNIPEHVKAYQKEVMIVDFYNKGEKLDWNNSDQAKYWPWFSMDDFSLSSVPYSRYSSSIPSRLYFLREEDCKEAVDKFLPIFKQSRLG